MSHSQSPRSSSLHRLFRSFDRPAVHGFLLRAASWLVPQPQRAEWLAEWRAELWHIAHERQLFATLMDTAEEPVEDALAFCLGAFPDAFWLRRHTPREGHGIRFHSARNCWFAVAAAAFVVTAIAIVLPGPRSAMQRAAYLNSNSVVQILPEGIINNNVATIPLANYTTWTHRSQSLFNGFVFYKKVSGIIEDHGYRTGPLSLAIASDNFFSLLQVRLMLSDYSMARQTKKPAVVLSEMSWRKNFFSDPGIIGHTIRIAGYSAVVVAIVPENTWSFPSRGADAWLLEDNTALATLNQDTMGFVFATVNPKAISLNPEINATRWHMEVPVRQVLQPMIYFSCDKAPSWYLACRNPTDSVGFDCFSLADTIERPSSIFIFMLVLALLALPATIPLSFGDAPVVSESLFAATRWRRWGFLLAKFAMIIPLVYFGSLDLAYGRPLMMADSEYIQLGVTFIGCLILFRWALHDQRQRCPTCLRLLTSPVRVGEPSRNFLAWSGTEMICSKGHGLLHTAELPTSWVGPRRWLHLDPSWKPLFTDAFTTLPS